MPPGWPLCNFLSVLWNQINPNDVCAVFQAVCCVSASRPSSASTTLKKPLGWRAWCPREEVSPPGTTDYVQVLYHHAPSYYTHWVFNCIFSLFSLGSSTFNTSGFPSATNMSPGWKQAHWPFVTWIMKPKKTVSLPEFQFQLGLCEWMGWIVAEPIRRVLRWSSRAVCFTGGCLHSSKPPAFLPFYSLAKAEEVYKHKLIHLEMHSNGQYMALIIGTIITCNAIWFSLQILFLFVVSSCYKDDKFPLLEL